MVQKTETISAGENLELKVADLPDNLQKLVNIYDETTDRLNKSKTDTLILSAANQWFLNSITNGVDAFLKSQTEDSQASETVEETQEPSTEG